jgi:hypothetical protein
MAGLPDLKQVAKSAMDKITGGYAAAGEMEEEEETDISSDVKALADALHHDGPDSPRVQQIIAKLEEHGLSRSEAIEAAGDAYGTSAGGDVLPPGEVLIKVMVNKDGSISYPKGTRRAEQAGEKGKKSPRPAADKKGKMPTTPSPRPVADKKGKLPTKDTARPTPVKGKLPAKSAPRPTLAPKGKG